MLTNNNVLGGIDAHQHFWQYNESEYPWMGAGEEWTDLKRSFLPSDLKPLLDAASLAGCVAVQARQSEKETEWLLELADNNSCIKGVVGWVNLRDPAILAAQLSHFTSHHAFVGVRHVIHDEADPIAFIMDPSFRKGIESLSHYGLTYDLLIKPNQLRAAIDLVAAFPEQTFILDHLGNPNIAQGVMEPWLIDLTSLASFSNVFVKLSGMTTNAKWNAHYQDDFAPYLNAVFNAFGPHREGANVE